MKLIRDLAPLSLVLLAAAGCTSSSQRGPAASAPIDSASEPSEPGAEVDSEAPHAAAGATGPVHACGPSRPVTLAPAAGPYRVRIVDAAMHDLRTFHRDRRSYVLGTVGERYVVVLSNPTPRRVEAVISIDGLDAIDGSSADYATKRGYILPAYGSATIEGFRTSLEQVATFRFSSVPDSYAGRKGQGRDVGVIGVAFFPEREVVAAAPPPEPTRNEWDGRRLSDDGAAQSNRAAPSPAKGAASPPASAPSSAASTLAEESSTGGPARDRAQRSGLGTEFGESRESVVEETEFVRANAATPSEITSLWYNDRAGLMALGFRLDPVVADAEVHLRETADPFRSNRFAAPPP
jgi:hypothetical protein